MTDGKGHGGQKGGGGIHHRSFVDTEGKPFGAWFSKKDVPGSPDADLARDLGGALEGAGRIAFIGVGNELHTADTMGLYVLWALRDRVAGGGESDPSGRFLFFQAGAVPENITGAVRAAGVSHAVLIDAAALGAAFAPGGGMVVPRDAIAGTALASHGLPLSLVCKFLADSAGIRPVVLGIQAPDMFTAELDEGTLDNMRTVVATVVSVLEGLPAPDMQK